MECLYYDDGKLKYRGEVVDGQPHGHGTGYWEDGKTVWYEGVFVDGKPQTYKLAQGDHPSNISSKRN